MDHTDFLALLNEIDFPDRYWNVVESFKCTETLERKNNREEIGRAFLELGLVETSYVSHGGFVTPSIVIGGIPTDGMLSNRSGLEMIFSGMTGEVHHFGGGFANLAYKAKQLADPSYSRSPFDGPKPYPRPGYQAEFCALVEVVRYFSDEVKRMQDALRSAI
jgi:hypothetical protein